MNKKNINPTTQQQWFKTCLIPRDRKKENLIRDTTGSIIHGRDQYV